MYYVRMVVPCPGPPKVCEIKRVVEEKERDDPAGMSNGEMQPQQTALSEAKEEGMARM